MLEELTENELESINGGFSLQEWTCMVAGGLVGGLVGLGVASIATPGAGIVAGVLVGATVEVVCNDTYP